MTGQVLPGADDSVDGEPEEALHVPHGVDRHRAVDPVHGPGG